MTNPIIEYGKQRDKAINDKMALEQKRREDAINDRKNILISQFEEVFESVLPALKASGVEYYAGISEYNPPNSDLYIEFCLVAEREKYCRIDFLDKSHYRYSGGVFVEWPVEELLGHLYDNLFKELPF